MEIYEKCVMKLRNEIEKSIGLATAIIARENNLDTELIDRSIEFHNDPEIMRLINNIGIVE